MSFSIRIIHKHKHNEKKWACRRSRKETIMKNHFKCCCRRKKKKKWVSALIRYLFIYVYFMLFFIYFFLLQNMRKGRVNYGGEEIEMKTQRHLSNRNFLQYFSIQTQNILAYVMFIINNNWVRLKVITR